jgi:hypothetical protein
VNCSFFLCRAACRTRSSACDTLSRSCARRVLCWPTFPLVPALRSTDSAADCSALFGDFIATTAVMLPQILCARRLSGPRTRRIFFARGAHKLGGNITAKMLCTTSRRSRTSRVRASPATAPRLSDADMRCPTHKPNPRPPCTARNPPGRYA